LPRPHSLPIIVSFRQKEILKGIIRASNSSQSKVFRAKIVLLASQGLKNKVIAKQLNTGDKTARLWRKRWAESKLSEVDNNLTHRELKGLILQALSDAPRTGTPPKFSAEQVTQILALACELPYECGVPISHWTPRLLTKEVIKRGIVESITEGSIRNFLKRSPN